MLRHSWMPRTVFNKMWCSFNAYWCPRGALCVVVEKRDPPTPHSSCPILMVKETPTLSTQRHRSPHPFHQNCPGDWGRRASCRFERETEFLHFHSSCSIPMVKGAPDEREKQSLPILHFSCSIPVVKETPIPSTQNPFISHPLCSIPNTISSNPCQFHPNQEGGCVCALFHWTPE